MEKKTAAKTPSQFYRSIRPEYFSDSDITYEVALPREVLAYELDKISTNQKQDQFETLCRRLAEKHIAPNLIPQVGPTGGGDGKTDTETFPVSVSVSERWFIPENGWSRDEKWAFAISAKQDWKEKIKGDIAKIVGTGRGYSRIYFMTNQRPSSKQKKELQDALEAQWKISVVVLDGEWLLETIYHHDNIELAVDALNLSDSFKKRKGTVGSNDSDRIKRLEEIENNIQNPNRYFEYDFQIVEDALEAAILSRMLEKPRQEVEGKFDRALRFCKKVNNKRQWIRVWYQKAWTLLNWYDDYSEFIEAFCQFKTYFQDEDVTISEVEFYVNLMNLLRTIHVNKFVDLSAFSINYKNEEKELLNHLNSFVGATDKPSAALMAQTYRSLFLIVDCFAKGEDCSSHLRDLVAQLERSHGHIEYSFEDFEQSIRRIGVLFPNHPDYDRLIDTMADVAQKRHSSIAAGELFLHRGGQKLGANFTKESIVYFGRAVLKLANEESRHGMCLALRGLAQAYRELDLLWASNNCYITACSLHFRKWFESGIVDRRAFSCVRELLKNELFLGRVPNFLLWHELYAILRPHIDIEDKDEYGVSEDVRNDICFAIRLLHTQLSQSFCHLPSVLGTENLTISQDASYYKLGYTDLLLTENNGIEATNEDELNHYYSKIADQPFVEQMRYSTNFCDDDTISFSAKIIGCFFIVNMHKNKELMIAGEALLAFFEAFFATSIFKVFPVTTTITLQLFHDAEEQSFSFTPGENATYKVSLNRFAFNAEQHKLVWHKFLELLSHIMATQFLFQDYQDYLTHLFKNEEVRERLALILEHRKFSTNVLGVDPKLTLKDWIRTEQPSYQINRQEDVRFELPKQPASTATQTLDTEQLTHSKIKIVSMINIQLWDKAKWQAFGAAVFENHLGVVLGFENGEQGKQIFDEWIARFGYVDSEEVIRISLIRGINKNHPFWYRVHISEKQTPEDMSPGFFYFTTSRFHEMNASTPSNLQLTLNGYEQYQKFTLYPAKVVGQASIEPYLDKGIQKQELIVRWAWEVGDNDIDSMAIKAEDDPYIPTDVIDAPVLVVLKRKRSK
jgi:hypothetical protein